MLRTSSSAEADGDEAHAILVEHFDDPGKVHQGTAEPVDLIDNDAVHGP